MAKENTAEPNPFTRSVVLRVPGAEAVIRWILAFLREYLLA